jgi:hypothetical protein
LKKRPAKQRLCPFSSSGNKQKMIGNRKMEVTLAFKGGSLPVIDENLKIFGLNVSVLGRASEEIVKMLHLLWNWESMRNCSWQA